MKKIIYGNLVLIVCCAFYLAWWILAFRPEGASGGMKTKLLLGGAFITGILAIYLTVSGIRGVSNTTELIPARTIIITGIVVYIVLLLVTSIAMKRPVTTELLLIIGWAMLEISAVNVTYGGGNIGHSTAIVLCTVIIAAVVISMICYMLYYKLEADTGYYTAMVPLITEAAAMAGITITIGIQI